MDSDVKVGSEGYYPNFILPSEGLWRVEEILEDGGAKMVLLNPQHPLDKEDFYIHNATTFRHFTPNPLESEEKL